MTAPARAVPSLSLALPKGRILDEAVPLFLRAGIDLSPIKAHPRRLVHDLEVAPLPSLRAAPAQKKNARASAAKASSRASSPEPPAEQPEVFSSLRVFVIRDADVPTFVEHGAADLGIAGSDVLEEQGRDLYRPLDLHIGRCHLSVAEPADRPVDDRARLHLRVATKFPNLTRRYLEQKGLVAEVIKLYGSIELAPLTGLADRIVDLVSTGETLRQNHLRELETILEVSAHVVVNRASLKLRRAAVDALVLRLREAVQ